MNFKTRLIFFLIAMFQILHCSEDDDCITLKNFELKFRQNLGNKDLSDFFTVQNFLGKGSNSITYRIDWFVIRNGRRVNVEAAARVTDIGNLSDALIKNEYEFSRSLFKKVGNCVSEPHACIIDPAFSHLIPDRDDELQPAKEFKKASSLRVIIMENGLGDLSTSFGENPLVNKIIAGGLPTILNVFRQISFCIGRFHGNKICHADIKNDNYIIRNDNLALENHMFEKKSENDFRIMIIDYSDARTFGDEVQSGTLKYSDKTVISVRKNKRVIDKWENPDFASPERDIYAMGMSFLYILCNESSRKEIAQLFRVNRETANQKIYEDMGVHLKNHPILRVCNTDPAKPYCFKDLMENMLAVERGDRTLNADQIYERLENLMKIAKRNSMIADFRSQVLEKGNHHSLGGSANLRIII